MVNLSELKKKEFWIWFLVAVVGFIGVLNRFTGMFVCAVIALYGILEVVLRLTGRKISQP